MFKEEKSIKEILNIKNKNDLVFTLYLKLLDKVGNQENIEILTNEERNVYLSLLFYNELASLDSLFDFYVDSYGFYCYKIVDALNEVGAKESSLLLKEANDLFPDLLPEDERDEYFDNFVDDEIEEKLEEYTENILEELENLDEILYKYIVKNKDKFID